MAPSLHSQQTEQVIDVSQDAVSSSPGLAAVQDQLENSVEVVKDSYKDKTQQQHRSAASPPEYTDEEDEMFSVLPQARIAQNIQKPRDKHKGLLFSDATRQMNSTLTSPSTSIPAAKSKKSQPQDSLATHSLLIDRSPEVGPAQPSHGTGKLKQLESNKTKGMNAMFLFVLQCTS